MKKVVLLTILVALVGFNLKASHSNGGEITYEWVSGNTYKVKLTLFVDCSSAMPNSIAFNSFSATCGINRSDTLYKSNSGEDVSQVCDIMQTTCNGGSVPGQTKWTYEANINGYTPCNDWRLSYQHCCRNAALLNITSPGTKDFYIETTFDNTVHQNNKSPFFADNPRWMIPVNINNLINAGAYDNFNFADHDSLHFSLVAPKDGAGSPIAYSTGYSAIQPFGGTSTTIDSKTGIISTLAPTVGQFLIAVKVDEFRNGQLISSVTRDFSVNVYNGSNVLPSITNPTLNFTVCNTPDTFSTVIFSTDPTDTINTYILPGHYGTNYFSNSSAGILNDTNTFNYSNGGWNSPYQEKIIYLNVEDDACPIKGIQSYAVVATEVNCSPGSCMVSIPQDTITACQSLAQLQTVLSSGHQFGVTYSWSPSYGLSDSTSSNPYVTAAHNQTYIVTATDGNGCISQDSITVSAYNPVFDTIDVCFPDSTLLDFGPGATGYFWQTFTDTAMNVFPLTDTTQTIWASQPGQYFGYANFPGCGSLTSNIVVEDTCIVPCITFDIVTTSPSCPTCTDGTASVTNITGGCPPYSYSWNTVPPQNGPVITVGTGTYQVTVTGAGACCPPVVETACVDCDSVWPGDANSDLIADVLDIFPIGVYYGNYATPRPNATTNWIGQWSADWGITQLGSGVDIKHADCNGDSIIDNDDSDAILLNYGLIHARLADNNQVQGVNDPPLYADISPDTVGTGTPLAIPIKLGTSAIPADSVYGIVLKMSYDKTKIDSIAGVTVDFSNSWLGTEGVDMITLDTNFYDNGRIDIGLVRTDGQMINNAFGEILTLNVITIDNLSGKSTSYGSLVFDFIDAKIIDINEGDRLFNQQLDSVVIKDVALGIRGIESNNFIIAPNPNTGRFTVTANSQIEKIEIYNSVGQQINFNSFSNINGNSKIIDLSNNDKGVYIVKVLYEDESFTIKKLIVK